MNNTIAKNYWFWVVLVLAAGAFFFFATFDAPVSINSARLAIKFDDGRIRTFEGLVEKDTTVLQALISASKGGGFDLRYSLDKKGSIDLASIGEVFNGPKNWHFYINGSLIETGELDRARVQKGDLIEARYE